MTAVTTQLIRLRPIVHVSPVPGGVHFRGWSSSFSVSGGNGLWRVWQALAPRLTEGVPASQLCPAEAPSTVQLAAQRIVDELWKHDMLVTIPKDWARETGSAPGEEVLRWLESVADEPNMSWLRLAEAQVLISGDGPVAWSAIRALRRTGLSVTHDPAVCTETTTLSAAGWSVRAGADDVVGYVLPPLATGRPSSGEGIAGRLGMSSRHGAPSALHSLIGAVGAHRLVCAIGALPDPGRNRGARGNSGTAEPVPVVWRPASVFVARMDPLRAEYRPWLGQAPAVQPADEPQFLDDALTRYEALCDPELGSLIEHHQAELVQTPAALAACRFGTLVAAGTGATADAARVAAGVNAVQQLARRSYGDTVFAGATEQDAIGRALRHVWSLQAPTVASLDEAAWAGHPAARRWFKALTLRCGVAVDVVCEVLAPGVHRCTVRSTRGLPLATAVEARAGDAAAFALLDAVGRFQWCAEGGDRNVEVLAPCGSSPSNVRDASTPVAWADEAWTWPASVSDLELAFAKRLGKIPDGSTPSVRVIDAGELSVSHTLVELRS